MDDEVANVFVNDEAEIASDDFIQVSMSDSDAIKVPQCALCIGARETSRDAETVFRRNGRCGKRSDVEEDDHSGGRLELLQEMDKDGRSAVWTAGFIKKDAHASESAD